MNGLDTDAEESTISNISNNTSSETIDENSQQNQNANETTLDTDFPTAQRLQPQLPEETSPTIEVNYSASENASVEVPGCLPKYKALEIPCLFNWGLSHNGKMITDTVLTSTIDKAYDEISQWRKNTFLVPYGKTGRDFIDKLTEHINDWNAEVVIFWGIKYEPLSDPPPPPVIKTCKWGPWGRRAASLTKSGHFTIGSWASKTKQEVEG